jgi:hypothetical protein
MNTKRFTGLALAAALLIAGPAYAKDDHKGGGRSSGHVASAHHSSGERIASSHRVSHVSRANVASRRAFSANRTRDVAANRNGTRNRVARTNFARNNVARTNAARNNVASRNATRNSVAFGGNAGNRGGHGQYAFASHAGWNPGQRYFWHGHRYGWYGTGWYIIDPGFGYYDPGYGYGYNGGSVSVQVQEALSQQGYYNGPIDGLVGPGTSAAIANYQQNNGLRVTGTITHGLLNSLGIG